MTTSCEADVHVRGGRSGAALGGDEPGPLAVFLERQSHRKVHPGHVEKLFGILGAQAAEYGGEVGNGHGQRLLHLQTRDARGETQAPTISHIATESARVQDMSFEDEATPRSLIDTPSEPARARRVIGRGRQSARDDDEVLQSMQETQVHEYCDTTPTFWAGPHVSCFTCIFWLYDNIFDSARSFFHSRHRVKHMRPRIWRGTQRDASCDPCQIFLAMSHTLTSAHLTLWLLT